MAVLAHEVLERGLVQTADGHCGRVGDGVELLEVGSRYLAPTNLASNYFGDPRGTFKCSATEPEQLRTDLHLRHMDPL